MSELKPGDLAVVVRDCCGHWVGALVTVGPIGDGGENWLFCEKCRVFLGGPASKNQPGGRMRHSPLRWLKKIEPLAETELAQEKLRENA